MKKPREFWMMLAPVPEKKEIFECLAYAYEPEHSALRH